MLKLELVQLLLRLVQLRRAWLCCETGATGFLLPQLVELPLRVSEFLGVLEILQLFALGEFVDLFLLAPTAQRAVGASRKVNSRRFAVTGLSSVTGAPLCRCARPS